MVICLVPAACRQRSMASATSSSTRTGSASSRGSSFWTRDRSMSSCTRLVRRVASICMRPANRSTASGSSEASMTASDSSESAPTGVFSSWLTLATKSRRTASMRRASVRSSTSSSTSRDPRGRHACGHGEGLPRPVPRLGRSSSTGRISPRPAGCPGAICSMGSTASLPPRTRPRAYAAELVLTTASASSRTTAEERSARQGRCPRRAAARGPCVERGARGALLLSFAPAERQHGDDTGEYSGDRCRCGDRRVHVHASRLGMPNRPAPAIGLRPRTLVAQSSPWSQGWFICGAGNGRVQAGTCKRGGTARGPSRQRASQAGCGPVRAP